MHIGSMIRRSCEVSYTMINGEQIRVKSCNYIHLPYTVKAPSKRRKRAANAKAAKIGPIFQNAIRLVYVCIIIPNHYTNTFTPTEAKPPILTRDSPASPAYPATPYTDPTPFCYSNPAPDSAAPHTSHAASSSSYLRPSPASAAGKTPSASRLSLLCRCRGNGMGLGWEGICYLGATLMCWMCCMDHLALCVCGGTGGRVRRRPGEG